MTSSSFLLVLFAGWLTLAVLCCGGQSSQRKTLTPAQTAKLHAGKDKACTTMRRLQSAGGFTKIEPGYAGVTHAYVDHAFFAIPVDAKKSALEAVALCYIDLDKQDQLGIVIIHDGYSGKQIGKFDLASGVDMDWSLDFRELGILPPVSGDGIYEIEEGIVLDHEVFEGKSLEVINTFSVH